MRQIGITPTAEQPKTRQSRRIIPATGATLALALVLALMGCSARPAVRIGLLVRAGDSAAALSATRGAQLALKRLNGAKPSGGAGGTGLHFQLEVVEVGDPASIERRMSALASGGAIGVVTNDQAVAEAAAASAARVRLSLIDAAPIVQAATEEKNPFLFLAGSTLDAQAVTLASFARSELHATRALLIPGAAGPDVERAGDLFAQAFSGAGGFSSTRAAASDFLSVASAKSLLDRTAADVIFMPSPDPGALRMIRAASAGRSPVPALGTGLWLRDVPPDRSAGLSSTDPFAGTYVSALWTLSAAGPKSPFVLAFRAAFGAPPDESSALSYDAISALAAAAGRDAHPAARGLQTNLAKLGPFRGATGVIQFNAAGATDRTLLILRRERGSYTIFERIEPQGIHDFGETDPFMNGN